MFTDETGIGPIESVKMGENARERERERETEKMKIGGRKALVGPTMPFLKCTDISSVRERTRHLGIFSSLSQRFFRSTFSFIFILLLFYWIAGKNIIFSSRRLLTISLPDLLLNGNKKRSLEIK